MKNVTHDSAVTFKVSRQLGVFYALVWILFKLSIIDSIRSNLMSLVVNHSKKQGRGTMDDRSGAKIFRGTFFII